MFKEFMKIMGKSAVIYIVSTTTIYGTIKAVEKITKVTKENIQKKKAKKETVKGTLCFDGKVYDVIEVEDYIVIETEEA